MALQIDDFLARLNRKGTLTPVSEAKKKAYRNTLEQFQRFLNGRQPTQFKSSFIFSSGIIIGDRPVH